MKAATVRRSARRAGSNRDGAGAVLQGIRRLDRGLRLAARRGERETGLSAAQLFVLERVSETPALSLSELAARTITDRSSVSAVVDRLTEAGLVQREVSAGDRRRQEIHITTAGRRRLRHAPAAPTDLLLAALRRWPRSKAMRLGRMLAELNEALGFEEAAMLFEVDGDAR